MLTLHSTLPSQLPFEIANHMIRSYLHITKHECCSNFTQLVRRSHHSTVILHHPSRMLPQKLQRAPSKRSFPQCRLDGLYFYVGIWHFPDHHPLYGGASAVVFCCTVPFLKNTRPIECTSNITQNNQSTPKKKLIYVNLEF